MAGSNPDQFSDLGKPGINLASFDGRAVGSLAEAVARAARPVAKPD